MINTVETILERTRPRRLIDLQTDLDYSLPGERMRLTSQETTAGQDSPRKKHRERRALEAQSWKGTESRKKRRQARRGWQETPQLGVWGCARRHWALPHAGQSMLTKLRQRQSFLGKKKNKWRRKSAYGQIHLAPHPRHQPPR